MGYNPHKHASPRERPDPSLFHVRANQHSAAHRRASLSGGKIVGMVTIRVTKKLAQRLGPMTAPTNDESAGWLGPWYATHLPWRPRHLALFVNESTLLPLLVPLAPTRTLWDRFPHHVAALLQALELDPSLIEVAIREHQECRTAPTADRSVVGTMNEFVRLASIMRGEARGDLEFLQLSLRLARTPCGPLFGRHVSPDRELIALANRLLAPPASASYLPGADGTVS